MHQRWRSFLLFSVSKPQVGPPAEGHNIDLRGHKISDLLLRIFDKILDMLTSLSLKQFFKSLNKVLGLFSLKQTTAEACQEQNVGVSI